jgi:hypothetical protein
MDLRHLRDLRENWWPCASVVLRSSNPGNRMKYAELHCASAFSFLEGASQPEDLVERAAELELPAVALVDRNTVSGAPRFWKAARDAGIKPLVGAEIVLDENSEFGIRNSDCPSTHGQLGAGKGDENSEFGISARHPTDEKCPSVQGR